MKIILSRKGFDSASGGKPSPILPNGDMVTLPVPTEQRIVTYSQLSPRGHNLGVLVECLSRKSRKDHAHLDPDLDVSSLKRKDGWLPCFGQDNASLGHLENQSVGDGDLFLFFGLFQQTQYLPDGLVSYASEAERIHVLFGWLQVGEVLDAEDPKKAKPYWSQSHPHIAGSYGKVFVARKHLLLKGESFGLPGAGVFSTFSKDLQLSAANKSCRQWHLPGWFHPKGRKSALTYHSDFKRWKKLRSKPLVELTAVARGQEFVLNTDHYPEAIKWAKDLIERNGSK